MIVGICRLSQCPGVINNVAVTYTADQQPGASPSAHSHQKGTLMLL